MKTKKLNPTKLNLLVCDLGGWTPSPSGKWTQDPAGLKGPFYMDPPSYCWSLDECAKLRDNLTLDQRDSYHQQLYYICEQKKRMASIYWLMVDAEPLDHCLAFVRAVAWTREEEIYD